MFCFLFCFVQDNLINQKMMVMLLRKLGYEILVAANGREALNLLETEARRGRAYEVQCILMDASMDVMDGMECARIIRAQQLPSRTRPFIIAQTVSEQHAEWLPLSRVSRGPSHSSVRCSCVSSAGQCD